MVLFASNIGLGLKLFIDTQNTEPKQRTEIIHKKSEKGKAKHRATKHAFDQRREQ